MVVTVSQVNKRIALMIKGDKALQDIYVRGEISNFVNHYKTGHFYFTLKDGETAVKAVMFRSNAERLNFLPENGMSVIIHGAINVFERDGQYQLYANEMQPEGVGELYLGFEQLKQKLAQGGYFNQKRPLPAMPRCICIITARTGAALQDMLNIIGRRYPIVKVKLIPVLVQGADAPESIVKALQKAQTVGADLIIFGRGGGSVEDLWAFNNEQVAMAIYNSKIPTISAVGHETDFTIADFAADLRAPTPSAAAELAVPDKEALKNGMDSFTEKLLKAVYSKIESAEKGIEFAYKHIKALSPSEKIKADSEKLELIEKQLKNRMESLIDSKSRCLAATADMINALSPLNTIMRGYAIVMKENTVVKSAESISKGDRITIRMNGGEISAVVDERKSE